MCFDEVFPYLSSCIVSSDIALLLTHFAHFAHILIFVFGRPGGRAPHEHFKFECLLCGSYVVDRHIHTSYCYTIITFRTRNYCGSVAVTALHMKRFVYILPRNFSETDYLKLSDCASHTGCVQSEQQQQQNTAVSFESYLFFFVFVFFFCSILIRGVCYSQTCAIASWTEYCGGLNDERELPNGEAANMFTVTITHP